MSLTLLALLGASIAPQDDPTEYEPQVAEASDEGRDAMAGFQVPEGFRLEIFASEPALANPVAFVFDPQGRAYVCETFRHHKGVTDMRSHMGWLEDDIAALTVEDRVNMFRTREGEEAFREKYCVEHERLRRIEDTDGDGVADSATVFADGFDDPAAGIAAGVLVRPRAEGGQDVWYACIPDMWVLTDADDDGVAEAREKHSTGYGVRVALLGHDMHGFAIGPLGRLYWSIGDRGFHVVTREGETLAHAQTGAVLRCELDGSNLEVFCTGLRNPQELVFDDRGDLFTGDNNSDGGDQARWTWLLEGSDTGWRQAYQWSNKPHVRGAWNQEQMWKPASAERPEQPWFVLPPIANFTSGPSGLTAYPGTGWSPEWNGTFFLCDFRGTPRVSGVHAFRNAPKGAGFELVEAQQFLWNCLPTDVDFAFDGNLYSLDWVNGWNQTGKGRIYRLVPESRAEGEEALIAEVAELLQGAIRGRSNVELGALLDHADRRVRLEAQLLLAERALAEEGGAEDVMDVLEDVVGVVADASASTRHRVHGMWLCAHVGRIRPDVASQLGGLVLPRLWDDDAELRAQAARVVGELASAGIPWPGNVTLRLVGMLESDAPRTALFAAEALGHVLSRDVRAGAAPSGEERARPALVAALAARGGTDPWLREALIGALTRSGDAEWFGELASHPSAAVRRALAVCLRRRGDAAVAKLLDDADPLVAAEAANAIHGARISDALPDLARYLERADGVSEYTFRRAVDANRLVGGAEAARRLASFAVGERGTALNRAEAIEVLAGWTEPRTRDLVIMDRWPIEGRPGEELDGVAQRLTEVLASGDASPRVLRAWIDFSRRTQAHEGPLGGDIAAALESLARNAEHLGGKIPAGVRRAALECLRDRREERTAAVAADLIDDSDGGVRSLSVGILGERQPEVAVERLMAAVREGRDAGFAVAALGGIEHASAARALLALGDVPGLEREAWFVEWLEAADGRSDDGLKARAAAFRGDFAHAHEAGDLLAGWRAALAGGDVDAGRKIFRQNESVTCTKCHVLGGEGGSEAGPPLDGVASRLTPEELLRSVVDPNAAIADGFQNWLLRTTDGEVFVGRIVEETDELVVLETNQKEQYEFTPDEIEVRRRDLSAMPQDTSSHLTLRQMRDLQAFLRTLKN